MYMVSILCEDIWSHWLLLRAVGLVEVGFVTIALLSMELYWPLQSSSSHGEGYQNVGKHATEYDWVHGSWLVSCSNSLCAISTFLVSQTPTCASSRTLERMRELLVATQPLHHLDVARERRQVYHPERHSADVDFAHSDVRPAMSHVSDVAGTPMCIDWLLLCACA